MSTKQTKDNIVGLRSEADKPLQLETGVNISRGKRFVNWWKRHYYWPLVITGVAAFAVTSIVTSGATTGVLNAVTNLIYRIPDVLLFSLAPWAINLGIFYKTKKYAKYENMTARMQNRLGKRLYKSENALASFREHQYALNDMLARYKDNAKSGDKEYLDKRFQQEYKRWLKHDVALKNRVAKENRILLNILQGHDHPSILVRAVPFLNRVPAFNRNLDKVITQNLNKYAEKRTSKKFQGNMEFTKNPYMQNLNDKRMCVWEFQNNVELVRQNNIINTRELAKRFPELQTPFKSRKNVKAEKRIETVVRKSIPFDYEKYQTAVAAQNGYTRKQLFVDALGDVANYIPRAHSEIYNFGVKTAQQIRDEKLEKRNRRVKPVVTKEIEKPEEPTIEKPQVEVVEVEKPNKQPKRNKKAKTEVVSKTEPTATQDDMEVGDAKQPVTKGTEGYDYSKVNEPEVKPEKKPRTQKVSATFNYSTKGVLQGISLSKPLDKLTDEDIKTLQKKKGYSEEQKEQLAEFLKQNGIEAKEDVQPEAKQDDASKDQAQSQEPATLDNDGGKAHSK